MLTGGFSFCEAKYIEIRLANYIERIYEVDSYIEIYGVNYIECVAHISGQPLANQIKTHRLNL